MPGKKRPRGGGNVFVFSDDGSSSGGSDDEQLADYERSAGGSSGRGATTRLPIKRPDGSFVRNQAFDSAASQVVPAAEKAAAAESAGKEKRNKHGDAQQQQQQHQQQHQQNNSIANLTPHERIRRCNRLKLEMGELCEEILAKPRKACKQVRTGPSPLDQLLRWCKDADPAVARLALISGHLVFADILPSYRVRIASETEMGNQMKKETRLLREFERRLLQYYQRYLKCLGGAVELTRPNGSPTAMAVAAVGCLAELLKTRPDFNFRSNIIALLVPLMGREATRRGTGTATERVRASVRAACEHVFKRDLTGQVSLEIVHVVGKHVKARNYQTHPDLLRALFRLNLKVDLKDEGLQARLRKRARKKNKEDEISRGLRETAGVADQHERERNQAKMLEDLFVTFFRVMRKGGANSTLLQATMEGVARFSHLINMELVVDLVEALGSMMRADNLPLDAAFQCAIASLRTLRGPGAALQIDDSEAICYIYKLLPRLAACGVGALQDASLQTCMLALREAFVARREHSLERAAAFVKRMLTVSASLVRSEHALAMVSFARLISNRYAKLSQMLDCGEDRVLAQGFKPTVDDPEQCNALGASLWECVALTQHYHPTVSASAAQALRAGTSLEPQFQDPVNVLRTFSTQASGFNPPPRPPREHPVRRKQAQAARRQTQKLQKQAAKAKKQKQVREAAAREKAQKRAQAAREKEYAEAAASARGGGKRKSAKAAAAARAAAEAVASARLAQRQGR